MTQTNPTAGITILGLGPGDPGLLTRAAWDWLSGLSEITVRSSAHPSLAAFPPELSVYTFDDLYEYGEDASGAYEQMVSRVLALGRRPQGVTYAVAGHPMAGDATAAEVVRRAHAEGLPVRVIPGLSLIEPALTALGLDLQPQLTLIDALALENAHVPSFPPSAPALVTQVYPRGVAAQLKRILAEVYPAAHPLRLVHAPGSPDELVEEITLAGLDEAAHLGPLTCLYVPALDVSTSFEAFQEIIAHLRAPDGCPWDREQTHLSLRKHLLEETYETIEALDQENVDKMVEEFGDLLLQIVLHAQIGSEAGTFNMAAVLHGIHSKIVRRHPHVFGDVEVKGVQNVLSNWEKLKAAERQARGEERVKGLLDGVPVSFPSLAQAQEIQDRAARVGFDWDTIDGVLEKVGEEIREVAEAHTPDELAGEIGDLLFAVVNVARWKKVDAEAALRQTNARFRRRFRYIEEQARAQGRDLAEMTLAEMDVLWEAAKTLEERAE